MRRILVRVKNQKGELVRLHQVQLGEGISSLNYGIEKRSGRLNLRMANCPADPDFTVLGKVKVNGGSGRGSQDLSSLGLRLEWGTAEGTSEIYPEAISLRDQESEERKRIVLLSKWIGGGQLGFIVACLLLSVFYFSKNGTEPQILTESSIELIRPSVKPVKETVVAQNTGLAARRSVDAGTLVQRKKTQLSKKRSKVAANSRQKSKRTAVKPVRKSIKSSQTVRVQPKPGSALFSALDRVSGRGNSRDEGGLSDLAKLSKTAKSADNITSAQSHKNRDWAGAEYLERSLSRARSLAAGSGYAGGLRGSENEGLNLSTRGGGSTTAGVSSPLGGGAFGLSEGLVSGVPGESEITGGGLTRDQVEAVIRRHLGQIRYCYEKSLQQSPTLRGRVSVGFTIQSRGLVQRADVRSSTLNSTELEGCVLNQIKKFRFPKPVAGVQVKVEYPFHFKRQG